MRGILIVSILSGSAALGAHPEAREWKAPDGTVVKYRWSAPEALETELLPLIRQLQGEP